MGNGVGYIANDQVCKVVRIGTVTLKMEDETEKTLENVSHVPTPKLASPVISDEDYMKRTPCASTGCLMYLVVCTRPDIEHSANLVSRYEQTKKEALGGSQIDVEVP